MGNQALDVATLRGRTNLNVDAAALLSCLSRLRWATGATIQNTTQGEKQMTKFRTWDELSEVEQLQCIYSEVHKDVYGFRPRHATTEQWNSVKWLQEELDFLENTQDPLDNRR